MTAPANPCKHCKIRKVVYKGLRMCRKCGCSMVIRKLYANGDDEYTGSEPTEEELEEMIAKRRPTMPGKTKEEEKEEKPPEPYTIPRIRTRYKYNGLPEYGI